MEREIIGASAIALVAVIAGLIYLSNRSVRRAQESALPEPSRPATLADGVAAFYVSTVFADSPLKRVWAWGLGGRGKALVAVDSSGVSVERQGELGLFVSRDALTGVSRTSATIDKGVEKDGLIALIWRLGDEELATHLRIVGKSQRQEFENAIREHFGVEIG
ncbi:MAG: hypothetical protein RIS08_562 [Actinomycetota bacterium]|jgi:hypothetical protein